MILRSLRQAVARCCALALPLFVVVEVNYPHLVPQSQLALFALLGLTVILLPERAAIAKGSRGRATGALLQTGDWLLALLAAVACGYVLVHSEPWFERWWWGGASLGDRAGIERPLDFAVGVVGLIVVLEATRRAIGWTLPCLSLAFVFYARWGAALPDWLLPHKGYGLERIVSQTFLHSQGVFGVALEVMFSYVFLFIVFGTLLEATGATGFVLDLARLTFRRTTGGPAKVAVLSSGLMGSLSGSAVANTATTGTFTIPMMKSSGLAAHQAAGLEAAASSGGALMPPVMGAGAYMMLEIIDPPVTYLQIIKAALIPAVIYYLSIYFAVHLRTRQMAPPANDVSGSPGSLIRVEGLIFFSGLVSLVVLLVSGFSVFRAVTLAAGVVLVISALHPRTRLGFRQLAEVLVRSSRSGVALIGAAACVGIVIGVVTLTGIGARMPALILPLAQEHLLLALLALMVSSMVLGMGLPSAVCYLLLATVVGPVLGGLGVVPLAAHLFIFYFGLMSMVTPPVALAAFAASSIAGSSFLASSVAAFRFALVGFLLPFVFCFRPQLLMLTPTGEPASLTSVILVGMVVAVAQLPLAAAITGYWVGRISKLRRLLLLAASLLAMFPGPEGLDLGSGVSIVNLVALVLFAAVVAWPARVE